MIASTTKALTDALRRDNWTRLSFSVAKELGMTVQQLHENITPEELLGWSSYFQILNEEQEEEMRKARLRR